MCMTKCNAIPGIRKEVLAVGSWLGGAAARKEIEINIAFLLLIESLFRVSAVLFVFELLLA